MSVKRDFPAGTTLGGVSLTNGTVYPIYTFSVASNTWTFETNGTVGVQNANNTWPVTFTVTHFSEHGALDQVPRCNATISVTGTTGTGITFEFEGEGSLAFEAEGQVVSGSFTLTNIPASFPSADYNLNRVFLNYGRLTQTYLLKNFERLKDAYWRYRGQ